MRFGSVIHAGFSLFRFAQAALVVLAACWMVHEAESLGFAAAARTSRPRVTSTSAAKKQGPPAGRRGARSRGDKKNSADKKAAVALEKSFLMKQDQGVGGGIDSLALADAVANLRRWPPAEQRRLLNGDWQLVSSDGGDLFIQMGSGLHGLPFMEVGNFFISLRTSLRQVRAVEVLKDIGPFKRVTTMLKGDLQCKDGGDITVEYTGMVDKDGGTTRQETEGATRSVDATVFFVGEKALVLRVDPTADRKGGFAVFERKDDLVRSLREVTGETCAILPGR